MTTATTQKLVADLRVLIDDAETLAKETAAQGGEKIVVLRNRMQQAAADLKPRLREAEAALEERSKEAVRRADGYAHAHPWTVAGVAAGAAFLAGLLAGRR